MTGEEANEHCGHGHRVDRCPYPQEKCAAKRYWLALKKIRGFERDMRATQLDPGATIMSRVLVIAKRALGDPLDRPFGGTHG